jgi:hypothetical protein
LLVEIRAIGYQASDPDEVAVWIDCG